ncbi:hypothetical protein [Gulosibacter chungangensis]|uniref:GGDEF domain-containing protein n=1 Tax=Gulosibacter chungangensis TaxID=979746 RepID=A0A7J5B7L7_9MICO|nr:hypothetical protein [Gulosibacter chungangensis]KAB1641000.1 hypothetical protein F8O05_13905 [Gulosibacter chungangensis]
MFATTMTATATATAVTITVDNSVSLIALVAVSTALVIGLATLARPSYATIAWGVGFGIGLVGTFLWVAGNQFEHRVLQAVASGLILSFEPCIWLGLRYFSRKRPIWWPVLAFVIGAPVVLGIGALTDAYTVIFRAVYLVAGIFAVLIAVELMRGRRTGRDMVLPLAIVSCLLAAVAAVSFVVSLINTDLVSGESQLTVLRDINRIGILISAVCGAFTLVLLVRSAPTAAPQDLEDLERTRSRLLRAKDQRDRNWSVLDIRLDDRADLREAWTATTYRQIVQTFQERVCRMLPATADAHRVADDRAIVVIHGDEDAVERYLRSLLRAISVIEEEGPLAGVRVSASVGWAPAAVAGYELDELVQTAADAATRARRNGGDRWERVQVPRQIPRQTSPKL